MSTLPSSEPDDSLFDERLRNLYDAPGQEAAAPAPPAAGWAGVESRLRPDGRRLGRPVASGVLGLVLGVLLMLWWRGDAPVASRPAATPTPTVTRTTPPSGITPTSFAGRPTPIEAIPNQFARRPTSVRTTPDRFAGRPTPVGTTPQQVGSHLPYVGTTPHQFEDQLPSTTPATPTTPASAPPAVESAAADVVVAAPATSSLPVVLQGVVQTETTYAALPATDSSTETRAARRQALRAERAALAVLTHRADSLLLTLGESPLALTPTPALDSVVAPPQQHRWSVLLAGAPERSFLGLEAPAADTTALLRRNHEQGRGGFNASVMAEYRLNPRWSVAVGAGLSTTGAELRLTDRRTVVGVTYDTTTVTKITVDSVTVNAYSASSVLVPHVTPIFNQSGQVVGYDTVQVPTPDTVWTVYTAKLVKEKSQRTITPLISRHDEVTARILRPTYHFLTVPLLLRYRLGRATDWTSSLSAPRWWADVALGAQFQFFLGGSHLVTTDGGRTFRTERVGPHDGAFRPLSVAVLGQVAVNYALTQRLSASIAPTLRYQTESMYKASTGLTQKPTTTGVQLGVRYSF